MTVHRLLLKACLLYTSFEKAAAIDLAGRNVLEAVQMSVNPKVIETPNISAVAKDGDDLIYAAVFQIGDVTHSRHGGADFCLLNLHAGVHAVGVHPVFFKKDAAAVLFL